MNELKKLNEETKKEAIDIMGTKDVLDIRRHLSKRDLKKLEKNLAQILAK